MTHTYRPSDELGPLTDWPFDNPESDYVIVAGAPRASGRLDEGGPGHTYRLGVWRCTEGIFACNELGDELQTVLSGRVRVSWADGRAETFGPGDSFYTRRGDRVTWEVIEEVTKVFYSLNAEGF